MVVELMPKFSPFSPKVVAGQWIEMRLCAQMKAPHDQIGRDTLTRLIIVLISFRSFLDWYNKWMVLDGHRRKTCPKICIAMNGRSGQVTDAWLTAKRTNETNYGVSIYIFDNRNKSITITSHSRNFRCHIAVVRRLDVINYHIWIERIRPSKESKWEEFEIINGW